MKDFVPRFATPKEFQRPHGFLLHRCNHVVSVGLSGVRLLAAFLVV